jgi:hypothetical protein
MQNSRASVAAQWPFYAQVAQCSAISGTNKSGHKTGANDPASAFQRPNPKTRPAPLAWIRQRCVFPAPDIDRH